MSNLTNDPYDLFINEGETSEYSIYNPYTNDKVSVLAGKRDSKIRDLGTKTNKKISSSFANDFNPAEINLILSSLMRDRQLAPDSNKYLNIEGSYDGPTGRFYMMGTNRQDQPTERGMHDIKPGYAGDHRRDSVARYEQFPAGPEGVNTDDVYIDQRYPEFTARTMEALIKGSPYARQMMKELPFDPQGNQERFGSGYTEILSRADQSGLFGDMSQWDIITPEREAEILEQVKGYEDRMFREMYPNSTIGIEELTTKQSESRVVDETDLNDMADNLVHSREGFRNKVYLDSEGNPTVGFGHLLTPEEKRRYPVGSTIPQEQLLEWYQEDSTKAKQAASEQLQLLNLPSEAYPTLVSMNFQLGTNWLSEWKNTGNDIASGNYDGAIEKIADSKWARQTPVRAQDAIDMLTAVKQGNFTGVLDGVSTQKSIEDMSRDEALAYYRDQQQRVDAESGDAGDRASNLVSRFAGGLYRELGVDLADWVGESLNRFTDGRVGWDLGTEEEKAQHVNETLGINPYYAEKEFAEAHESAEKIYDTFSETGEIDYSEAYNLVKLGITTPELFVDSAAFIVSSFVPFLGWGGKASKVSKIKNIESALKAGKITAQQAKQQVQVAKFIGNTRIFAQKQAGLLQMSAGNVNDQIDTYKQKHGEAPSVAKVATMFGTEALLLGLDRWADLSILKSPAALKGVRDMFTALPKGDKSKVLAKTLGVAGGLTVNMGKEAAQEYVQEIGQEFNVQFNFDDNGDFTSVVNEAGEILLSKDMQVTGVTGAGLGAGGAVQFASIGAIGKGVKSLGSKAKDIKFKNIEAEESDSLPEDEGSVEEPVSNVTGEDLQSVIDLNVDIENRLREQSEEAAQIISEGGDVDPTSVNLFKEDLYETDIESIDKALDTLNRFDPKEETSKAAKERSIKGLTFARKNIIDNAISHDGLVLGSKLKVEELAFEFIDEELVGEEKLELPADKEAKVKKFLTANGVTDKEYKELKEVVISIRKDYQTVRQEATIGPKGYLTYSKRISNLLKSSNPNINKLQKEFDNLRSFRASQDEYVNRFNEAEAKLQETISAYNKDSSKPVPRAVYFNIKDGEMFAGAKTPNEHKKAREKYSNFINPEKVNGKYRIAKSSFHTRDLAQDNIDKINEILVKFKDKEEEFLGSDHFTDPDGVSGELRKNRIWDKEFYENNGVTKAIVSPEVKKWQIYGANDPSIVNPEVFSADDVVVLNWPSEKGMNQLPKEARELVRAAKEAGATIILDNNYRSDSYKNYVSAAEKSITTLHVDGVAVPYEKVGNKYLPVKEAEKEKEVVKEKQVAKKQKEQHAKDKLDIGIKRFLSETTIEEFSEEEKETYESMLKDFDKGDSRKDSEERFEKFVRGKVFGEGVQGNGLVEDTVAKILSIKVEDTDDINKALEKKEILKSLNPTVAKLVEDVIKEREESVAEVNELLSEWVKVSNEKDPKNTLDSWLKEKFKGKKPNQLVRDILSTSVSKAAGVLTAYRYKDDLDNVKKGVATKPGNVGKGKNVSEVVSRGTQELDINKIVEVTKNTVLGVFNIDDINVEVDKAATVQAFFKEAIDMVDSAIKPIKEAKTIVESVTAYDGLLEDVKDSSGKISAIQYRLMDNPAVSLLFNSEGGLNDNTAVALYTSLHNYINTSNHMLKDGMKSKSDLAAMIGKREEEITVNMQKALKDKGVFSKSAARSIGLDVLAQLGLKDKNLETVDKEVFNKLVSDLGNVAILAGVSKGLLKVDKSMSAYTYASKVLGLPRNEISPGSKDVTLTFIRSAKESDIETAKNTIKTVQEVLPLENTLRIEPSFTKLTKEELDDQVKHIKRDMFNLGMAQESEESLINLMNTEMVMDIRLAKQIVEYKDAIKKTLGYIEIDMENPDYAELSSIDKENQDSKNRDIERAIEEIELVAEGKGENVSMWFKYYMAKNGRLMLDSNTLNPQTVKQLHRFLIQPKEHENRYDVIFDANDNIIFTSSGEDVTSLVNYALGQAFGFAVDKLDPDKINEFSNKVLKHFVRKNRKASLKQLNKARQEFILSGKYRLPDDTELEMEHFSHALQAFNFIEDIISNKANKKAKVYSYLTAEFDAVTSGFGLKLLQLPVLKVEQMEKYLIKVGMLPSDSDILKDIKSKDKVTMNAVLDNEDINILDSYQELSSNIDTVEYTELENRPDSVRVNEIEDAKTWDILKETLPSKLLETDEDGNTKTIITSALRNLFKYPFILFNYAAAVKSIKKRISSEIFDGLVAKMAALDVDKLAKVKDLKHAEKHGLVDSYKHYKLLERITGFSDVNKVKKMQKLLRGGDDITNLIDVASIKVGGKGKLSVKNYLEGFISASYGNQVETILTDEFGPFLEAQDVINDAFKAMFEAFYAAYENEYAIAKKESNTGVVSKNTDREILNRLKKLMPAMAGPLTKLEGEYLNGGIGVYDTQTAEVSGHFVGLENSQVKLGEGARKNMPKTKDGKVPEVLSVATFMKEFKAAYSAGNVIPIHYVDGAIMSRVINKSVGGITAVHDAIIPSITKAKGILKTYNENVFKVNRDYSYVDEIMKSMEESLSFIKELEDTEENIPEYLNKQIEIEVKNDGSNKMEKEKVTVMEYLLRSRNSLDTLNKKVQKGRKELFEKMEGTVVMHMAAFDGSTYEITKKDLPKTEYKSPANKAIDNIKEVC